MSTISKENYIKTILVHKLANNASVTTNHMAQELEVSSAAVSDMAKKLSSEGLISYRKYKGMELTEDGITLGKKILRKHRLWELFLMKTLDLSWSEVHDEAEKLEHHASEFLIDKIDEILGYPDFDPHGEPIPRKNGDMPEMPEFVRLSEAEEGKYYKILKVSDKNSELIKYFTRMNLKLGTKIFIKEKFGFDGSVTIFIGEDEMTLSEKVTGNIFVSLFDNK